MKTYDTLYTWVKINRGTLPNDEDAIKLSLLSRKYNMNFNTHDRNAMWYSGDKEKAWKFAKAVVSSIPYLNVTIGNSE